MYAIYCKTQEPSCMVRLGNAFKSYAKALEKAKHLRALEAEVRHTDHYGHETVAACLIWPTLGHEPIGAPEVLQQLDFTNVGASV